MGVGPHRGAGAVRDPVVHRDDDTAAGDDRQHRGAEAVPHGHIRSGQLRWHRVPVPTEGHQGLRGDRALHRHDYRECRCRDRSQPLRDSETTNTATGPGIVDDPDPGVRLLRAERVEAGLGLRDGDIVG